MSAFLQSVIERAKQDKKTIVLPEGDDPRTLEAAEHILADGVAELIILGDVDAIGEISLSTGEVTFDSNAWYDLSGRKLNGVPTQKGIYIHKGKKVALH